MSNEIEETINFKLVRKASRRGGAWKGKFTLNNGKLLVYFLKAGSTGWSLVLRHIAFFPDSALAAQTSSNFRVLYKSPLKMFS
jgi:hypothetical protein